MKPLKAASDLLEPWTGSVATAIISAVDRAIPPRIVRVFDRGEEWLVESDSGKTVTKIPVGTIVGSSWAGLFGGAKVELMLDQAHCVFRPVEVPARAAAFLEGIVRAQIDRLTPWNAGEAVFGCSPPVANGGETITTIVAFTTRKTIEKYVGPLSTFHPAAISVWTMPPEHEVAPLKVFEQNSRKYLGATLLNRGLKAIFGLTGLAAILAVLAAVFLSNYLGGQQEELGTELSQRRAAIRANSSGNDRSPTAILRRHKLDTTPVVLVLDKLAAILPDNTYLTELHLADDKVQIIGVSADSSSLIPLIEQSTALKNATFLRPYNELPLGSRRTIPHRGANTGASERQAVKVFSTITNFLGRSPLVAAVLYLAVVGLFVTTAALATLGSTDQIYALQQTRDELAQLRSREGRTAPAQAGEADTDPFLEGSTLTVASAALQQRVNGAIVGAGGAVQSSQVDITTGRKDGVASLLINFELSQPALQKLLFDLETQTPLLFIDQIDVQTPQSGPANSDGAESLRVSLNVSGRWRAK